MRTFIRMAEVWLPSADGTLLEPGGGIYDAAPAFGAATRRLCFGRGEGLPGHVWDEGRPLLLSQLEGSYFVRTAAARDAGIGCALGLPVFAGDRLTSVVVLLCGERHHAGAVELWHNDPRITGDLRLQSGYFGASAAELETLSRDAWLPRGSGAPGLAWQRDAAVFIDGVAASSQFLRAQTAASAGIVRALSLPCRARDEQTWVVSLLSSSATPVARRIESWLPDDTGMHLLRAFGFCEVQGRLAADPVGARPLDAMGAIGCAAATGVAQAAAGGAGHAALEVAEAQASRVRSVLALPLMGEGRVSEVLAFYF